MKFKKKNIVGIFEKWFKSGCCVSDLRSSVAGSGMVLLCMHIFPSIYPSSNLLYGNLWAKENIFVNGPWWIFPSVNLLSWAYVSSWLPLCNTRGDGKKKPLFFSLDSFLVSLHLLPHFVLCKELCSVTTPLPAQWCPWACLVWPLPGLAIPFPVWEAQADHWFRTKTLPEGMWCCPRVGLASQAVGLGGWNSCALVLSGLKLSLTLFTQKFWKKWSQQRDTPEWVVFWLQNKTLWKVSVS